MAVFTLALSSQALFFLVFSLIRHRIFSIRSLEICCPAEVNSLSGSPEELAKLVQMCSIRFRAELCRTVDLEGRRWEALIERTNLSQAWMYSTFEMIRNVLPLACMVSFHALKAVILMLLSTGSAKSVSPPVLQKQISRAILFLSW